MPDQANLQLLEAVFAVATADDVLTKAEEAVFNKLAERVGANSMAIWRIKTRLNTEPEAREQLFSQEVPDPYAAMKLLVATARIDGEISAEERNLLENISSKLKLTGNDFLRAYDDGITAADNVRRRKK